MPKGFQLSIVPLLMLLVIAGPSLAQRQRTDYRGLQKVVLRELRETNTPGAAIAIVRGAHVIYTKGFGISKPVPR